MQDIRSIDNLATHPVPMSTAAYASERPSLTLVVQPRVTAVAPSAIAINLTGPAPRVVHSFPEACSVLLSEPVAVVLLVDDPGAGFSESELDVIGKLAGSASIVLMQPWQAMGARERDGAPQAAEPGGDAGQSQPLTVGALQYNSTFGIFKVGGRLLRFSQAETRLLLDVISGPGHYISVVELVNGGGVTGERRSEGVLRQFVYRIRRKLAQAGDPAFLVSVRSGYRLLSPGHYGGLRHRRHRGTIKAPTDAPAPRSEAPCPAHVVVPEPSMELPSAPQRPLAQAYS